MTLHAGSCAMAHHLDRFALFHDFESMVADAARLGVETDTIQLYQDWYGHDSVLVRQRGLYQWLPAYEAALRRDVFGEKLVRV